ncbi:MAG: IS3 family transposase, partial [Alcaligenaceae bacterium]|nr:IS3 family transposase [Alcaligenaceae bacterium]
HSKLNFVTPQQRHNGKDTALLAQRQAILEQAKLRNPSRWGTRSVRNCEPIGPVTLNPEKEIKMQQAA